MTDDDKPRGRGPARLLTRPLFWVLVFLLAWLTLIIVQIAMGMGTAPDGGRTPA